MSEGKKSVRGGSAVGGKKIKTNLKRKQKKTAAVSVKKTTRAKITTQRKRPATKRKPSVDVQRVPVVIDTEPIAVPEKNTTVISKRVTHPWSLRHHTVGILAITIVATAAMFLMTAFTDIAISNMTAYEADSSSLLVPPPTKTSTYVTPAGNMIVPLPASWEMKETTSDTITYTYINHPDITLTIRIQPQNTTSVIAWLQANDQPYVNGQVSSTLSITERDDGILINGATENGAPVEAAYWPITTVEQESFVMGMTLIYNDNIEGKLARQDLERAIHQVKFASAQ